MVNRSSVAILALAGALVAAVPVVAHYANDSGSKVRVIRGDEQTTEGSGKVVRQERSVGAFTAIVADDAVNVVVTIGPRHSLEVQADDNLIDRITARVEDGALRIGAAGSYSTASAPTVHVTVPRLDRVDLHSSSDARIEGIRGSRLFLSSNGSGSFDVTGRVQAVEVELYGSGDARLADLEADDVRIAIHGSSDAHVKAGKSLRAAVYGSGDIRYSGDSVQVEQNVYGNGTIRRAGA